jgi:hypothetical protein
VTDWANLPPLEPDRALLMTSDSVLHSVPLEHLDDARAIDPFLTVLATSPEEWRAFVAEQLEIQHQWSLRHEFTEADSRLLRAMGIAWDQPSLEELLLAILPVPAVRSD